MTDHHQSLREATAKTPQTAWGLVPASLLKHIYASDQAIYPAPDLSFARLQSWAAACPELFLCLANENTDASHQAINSDPGAAFDGVIIVLPLLRDAWEALLTGHVREHDIDPARMFPPTMNGKMEGFFEVGLHVFHVERFAGRSRSGFAALALEKVKSVAEQFRGWDVVGYSGEWELCYVHDDKAPLDCAP